MVPPRISRRRALHAGFAALAVGTSGCSNLGWEEFTSETPSPNESATRSPTTTETVPFETPAPGECTAETPPQPTPTEEGLEPMEYPEYPSRLTAASVETFAVAFEKAYQYNEFLAREFIPGTDEILFNIGVPHGGVTPTENGFTVQVNGELKTGDENQQGTESPAPYLDSPFSTWLYLTNRFVLRDSYDADTLEEAGGPHPEWATVVVCVS